VIWPHESNEGSWTIHNDKYRLRPVGRHRRWWWI